MMTLKQLLLTFPTEDTCRAFLQARRWPKGVTCPRCGKKETVYALANKAWHWECSNPKCRSGNAYRFSVLVGTVFENTKYPLRTWFEVLYTMLNSKKGVSSKQIERQIGSSYPTALYMTHRLRAGMQDSEFRQLMGVAEVDETYIGGEEQNKHKKDRSHSGTGGIGSGRTGVIGAISRKGNIVCRVIEDVSTDTVEAFIKETINDEVTLVATDEYAGYQRLHKAYPRDTVRHAQGEYVRGSVHTENLDSFWALLKRGIIGNCHSVSRKYLPLYLNQFAFRHSNRNYGDAFGLAIAGC